MTTDLRTADAVSQGLLGGAHDAVALVTAERTLTYGELAAEVERTGQLLGVERRLVMLEARNDLRTVITYLAALAGRHPVLLTAPGDVARHEELVSRYRPDVVQIADGAPRELRPGSGHDLHPELALLLSTSGSTGSPKLVRLSLSNVVANARSIADYLAIRTSDCAPTSLPLHYCYGLSVLNSHLMSGASVVLTDLSVADECFWDLARRASITSLAAVPYTFDLLDASGFRDRSLPSLRYLTQAGGRMAPSRVEEYAELGRRRGWDLFVMYGQTEATARMAYLPPDRAASRPGSIGIPVPGGDFRIEPLADLVPGVGELVYSGPNVMMGYAETPADLSVGAELAELRTGDLARQADDGLWEIVGRLNRQAKVFGLRLDLERVERHLADHGVGANIVALDETLCVFVAAPRKVSQAADLVREFTSLPVAAIRVAQLETFPLTPAGKVDHQSLDRQARLVLDGAVPAATGETLAPTPQSIRDLYAHLLGRPDATTRDTFVGLGGDSLSYVEVSARLADHLGTLPIRWPELTPAELAATAVRRRRFLVPVTTTVLLRAVAITMIVATHADLVQLQGGAHVLLAVAGFNLARFQLTVIGRGQRVRSMLRTVASIAVPACLWIGTVELLEVGRVPVSAFLLNGLLGSNSWDENWQYWFLEALAWTYLGLAALLAWPRIDRWQRRHPFGTAMTVVAAALVIRYAWVGVEAGPTERYTAGVVLWCIALGWAAGSTRTVPQRLLVAGIAVAATVGFFGDVQREAIVVVGMLLLLQERMLRLPRTIAVVLGMIAGASLWIYLTQWEIYPELEAAGHPVLAIVASLVAGVCCWRLHELTKTGVRVLRQRARARSGDERGPVLLLAGEADPARP